MMDKEPYGGGGGGEYTCNHLHYVNSVGRIFLHSGWGP